jgi:hypothetical protein
MIARFIEGIADVLQPIEPYLEGYVLKSSSRVEDLEGIRMNKVDALCILSLRKGE